MDAAEPLPASGGGGRGTKSPSTERGSMTVRPISPSRPAATAKGSRRRCRGTRIARFDEDTDVASDIAAAVKAATAKWGAETSIYPGVNCGHRDCLQYRVTVPNNMGWLWSLRETGGVKINRNWRPGAIPKNVVAVMEMARPRSSGIDGGGHQGVWSTTGFHNNNRRKTQIRPRSTAADPGKTHSGRFGRTVSYADDPHSTLRPNDHGPGAVASRNEPVMSMNKHKGQYAIQMNPMPRRNENGELVWPDDVEPVVIRLGRRGGAHHAEASSGSSMDIELVPQRKASR